MGELEVRERQSRLSEEMAWAMRLVKLGIVRRHNSECNDARRRALAKQGARAWVARLSFFQSQVATCSALHRWASRFERLDDLRKAGLEQNGVDDGRLALINLHLT